MDKDDDSKIFPQRLMEILADEENQDYIAWLPHGRAFAVRDRSLFAEKVMPLYFSRHAKYSSFTRKLNRWNFVRVSSGPELGAYYHEFFLRDKPHLSAQMFCKNARSKLAMRSKSPPPAAAETVTEETAVARSPSPPTLQGLTLQPTTSAVVAPLPVNPVFTLPPDIPLGLLESLMKLPPTSVETPGVRVPNRPLQQAQYANLLVERQIQILQAEQAKLMLLREATMQQRLQQELQLQAGHQYSTKTAPAADSEDAGSLLHLMEIQTRQKQNRGPVNHRASAA